MQLKYFWLLVTGNPPMLMWKHKAIFLNVSHISYKREEAHLTDMIMFWGMIFPHQKYICSHSCWWSQQICGWSANMNVAIKTTYTHEKYMLSVCEILISLKPRSHIVSLLVCLQNLNERLTKYCIMILCEICTNHVNMIHSRCFAWLVFTHSNIYSIYSGDIAVYIYKIYCRF